MSSDNGILIVKTHESHYEMYDYSGSHGYDKDNYSKNTYLCQSEDLEWILKQGTEYGAEYGIAYLDISEGLGMTKDEPR